MQIFALMFVLLVMILLFFCVCADYRSIYAVALSTSLLASLVSWCFKHNQPQRIIVLKFSNAAAHKTNVGSNGPSTNGDGCLVVIECFLHDLL